jgi:hypothetical protein
MKNLIRRIFLIYFIINEFQGVFMKKLIGIFCCTLLQLSFGQVLNTATTLSPGAFSFGVAPIIFVEQGNDLGLYVNAGLGVSRSVDLGFKLRFDGNHTYIGGDIEFLVLGNRPSISLATGVHAHHEVGIDGTFNLSFPLARVASLYCGLDADMDFYSHDTVFPCWGFFGLQVSIRRSLALLMEIDIGLNDPAYNMLDFGLNVIF